MKKYHAKLGLLLRGAKPIIQAARAIVSRAVGILLNVDAVLVREGQRIDEIIHAIEKA